MGVSVKSRSGTIRNRGPWTTVEYEPRPGWKLGHTTALGANAGTRFDSGTTTDCFMAFLGSMDQPPPYHSAEQVHADTIRRVGGVSTCQVDSDGLWTEHQDTVLTVRTADCLTVHIRSTHSARRATLHAGWRGLFDGIVPTCLNNHFSESVDLFVGPHVPVEAYEVGNDVVSRAEESLGLSTSRMVEEGVLTEQSKLELFEALRVQLRDIGSVGTVFRSSMDTGQTDPVPLLSYRLSKTDKRLLHWNMVSRRKDDH